MNLILIIFFSVNFKSLFFNFIGEHMDLKSCLELEYMLVQRFLMNSDFFEGVRALLVDKGDKPTWNPVNYIEVDEKRINWFFRPAPNDERINLAK